MYTAIFINWFFPLQNQFLLFITCWFTASPIGYSQFSIFSVPQFLWRFFPLIVWVIIDSGLDTFILFQFVCSQSPTLLVECTFDSWYLAQSLEHQPRWIRKFIFSKLFRISECMEQLCFHFLAKMSAFHCIIEYVYRSYAYIHRELLVLSGFWEILHWRRNCRYSSSSAFDYFVCIRNTKMVKKDFA